jgi:hypothetical protein
MLVAACLDDIREHGIIAPHLLAERLRLSAAELAWLAHINRNTMVAESDNPTVQTKLREIERIVARANELAGDEGNAIIWFHHQPIVGLGKTAAKLVRDSMNQLVFEELERMAAGVYS